jgi:hypothetical protein
MVAAWDKIKILGVPTVKALMCHNKINDSIEIE